MEDVAEGEFGGREAVLKRQTSDARTNSQDQVPKVRRLSGDARSSRLNSGLLAGDEGHAEADESGRRAAASARMAVEPATPPWAGLPPREHADASATMHLGGPLAEGPLPPHATASAALQPPCNAAGTAAGVRSGVVSADASIHSMAVDDPPQVTSTV